MFPHHLPEGPKPDPSRLYNYPKALRGQIADAPKAPGVYIFQGDRHPLYIGKSVNIRARLLSHFREPSEARLLMQTRRIDYIKTAGEISALILEAQMIKKELPLYNQRLRRSRSTCSIILSDGKVGIQSERDIDYGRSPDVFGLFKTRRAATDKLRGLADDHQLCLATMGLERVSTSRGCFRAAIGKCAGACCGRETVEAHTKRLAAALQEYQIAVWPYEGPIAIEERFDDLRQYHVIDRWRYLGGHHSLPSSNAHHQTATFDSDIYKILLRPILSGDVEIREL